MTDLIYFILCTRNTHYTIISVRYTKTKVFKLVVLYFIVHAFNHFTVLYFSG